MPPSGKSSPAPPVLTALPEQLATQLPAKQTRPSAHECPHEPQLAGSVCVFAQRPVPPPATVQLVVPVGHEATQAPLAQNPPPAQRGAQVPLEHVCPCPHALPQVPQLLMSPVVSMHESPHCWKPVPHEAQSSPPSACGGPDAQPLADPEP
jgi:hypothetical protein